MRRIDLADNPVQFRTGARFTTRFNLIQLTTFFMADSGLSAHGAFHAGAGKTEGVQQRAQ